MYPVPRTLHQLTLPTPFPVGPVHVYLLAGEPLTLLDTGPRTPEAREALREGLSRLGYGVEDIRRIIISHAHSDHFGLVGELVAASGAEVWAHALAQPAIEGWPAYAAQRDQFWGDLLQAAAVPAGRARATARLYQGFRHLQAYAPLSRLLAEGDVVAMGEQEWQVLHCPGHAGSLLCFYQPERRLLLGNDHLLAHISSNAIVEPPAEATQPRRKPLVDYWNSLKRVCDLEIDLVLTGHGDPVEDPRALIRQRFAFYEQRLARLRQELAGEPRTVWQLAEALFPRLDRTDTFLAVSEVLGHLDVLEARGEVQGQDDEAGQRLFRRSPAAPDGRPA